MVNRHSPGMTRRLTLSADKGYDAGEFVRDLRQACVTPHVAQKSRYSAIDGRTTRHAGYALSQKHRKKIEEAFLAISARSCAALCWPSTIRVR
jgi:hypothetical protein